MKTTLIALTLTALSSLAPTAHADVKTMPQVAEYTYGTKVDVAEATNIPNLHPCPLRPVDLGYVAPLGKPTTSCSGIRRAIAASNWGVIRISPTTTLLLILLRTFL